MPGLTEKPENMKLDFGRDMDEFPAYKLTYGGKTFYISKDSICFAFDNKVQSTISVDIVNNQIFYGIHQYSFVDNKHYHTFKFRDGTIGFEHILGSTFNLINQNREANYKTLDLLRKDFRDNCIFNNPKARYEIVSEVYKFLEGLGKNLDANFNLCKWKQFCDEIEKDCNQFILESNPQMLGEVQNLEVWV